MDTPWPQLAPSRVWAPPLRVPMPGANMMPYSQAAAAVPGTMIYPPAHVTRAPLREIYPRETHVWPGLENQRPPRSNAPSEELVRSIAEREYWRQQNLAEEARRQETETESLASSMGITGELHRVPTNQTFSVRSTDPAQDPNYREAQLAAVRSWFEDRRNHLTRGGGGNTSR